MGDLVSFLQWTWSGIGGFGGFVGLLGGFCGVVALFQTRKTNKIAQDANALAEKANDISADSKRVAEDANRLAGNANKISTDANSISQRALSVTADQTVYKWRVEFDGDSSTVFLVNDCPHQATDVHAFIRHENETVMDRRVDHIPAFGEVTFENEFFTEKIVEDQRSVDAINASGGGVYFIGSGSYAVDVRVAYTTELGSRRSDEIKKSLGHGKRH